MIQGFEEGYLRGGVGVVMSDTRCVKWWEDKSSNEISQIHRYGVVIHRIQHGIRCIQVDNKDWV